MSIGNKIYTLRSEKNLSQGELADKLDVSRQSVSKWETDAASPELDKLIKMCDIFDVTLDELTERGTKKEADTTVTYIEKTTAFTPQKIVGYILLATSLIGVILLFLLAENSEELYIPLPIIISMLVCSILCLLLRNNVGYWCAWAAFAPLSVLTPHIVGLPILSVIGCSQIIVFIAMGCIGTKYFKFSSIEPGKRSILLLISGWVLCIALYITALFIFKMTFIAMIIVNFIIYSAVALLVTYTAICIKSAKKTREH